ncbi:hypothetical protein BJD99_00450 [Rhodococcus sp. 1163]|nr:hypothetical protein BJD99_00450 [Rhodococcus sp. 1163]
MGRRLGECSDTDADLSFGGEPCRLVSRILGEGQEVTPLLLVESSDHVNEDGRCRMFLVLGGFESAIF